MHGKSVLSPQEITEILSHQDHSPTLAKADAVISDRPEQSVWVASADCTPVLIGDLATGQVCAIHAGWRGTAGKIVVEAVSRFLQCGSTVENLCIAIGPSISGERYQVDHPVAAKVGQTIVSDEQILGEAEIIAQLKLLDKSPVLADEQRGKIRLNVSLVNQIQLEQLGIKPDQIAIAPYCTFQSSEHFFSYRRTGEKKVQWSGIVSG